MPDAKIVRFIKRHHVLNLATCADGVPYSAACFYAYDADRNRLIFTSDETTCHATQMIANQRVSCAITLETRVVGRVQGLQVCGSVCRGDETDRHAYIKCFPYAAVAPLTLWALIPDFMKLTDNTLGFGKKLIWKSCE